jgi:hypothetical protein
MNPPESGTILSESAILACFNIPLRVHPKQDASTEKKSEEDVPGLRYRVRLDLEAVHDELR